MNDQQRLNIISLQTKMVKRSLAPAIAKVLKKQLSTLPPGTPRVKVTYRLSPEQILDLMKLKTTSIGVKPVLQPVLVTNKPIDFRTDAQVAAETLGKLHNNPGISHAKRS